MSLPAPDQLKSLIERIERVEEDIASLNADKSDIYKEARSLGFDPKIMRKVVAKRKLAADDRDEQDAVFEIYWNAVHGLVQVHTRTREEDISYTQLKTQDAKALASEKEREPIVVIPKREDNAGAQNIIEHRSGPHRPAEVNRWKS